MVKVSWEDARAFCKWLTEKERAAGVFGKDMAYRLPSDEEWSVAVGLPAEPGRTPQEKDRKIDNTFPWGTQWPPTKDAGNYDVDEADGYKRTSPAGSFAANPSGLYDLGGNVWEWCEDAYDGSGSGKRVLRGASFATEDPPTALSSNRHYYGPDTRFEIFGFRCVLVVSGG